MKIKSARRIRHHGFIAAPAALDSPDSPDATIVLDAETAHKIADVLRLTVGEEVVIVDDEGREHLGSISQMSPHRVEVRLTGETMPAYELAPVTIAVPLIKGERMDWAIEKVSECGVASVFPYVADRSVPRRCSEEKLKRWRRIAEAAALQSNTGKGPFIHEPAENIEAVIAQFRIRAHLDITGMEFSAFLQIKAPEVIFIGPEGGWSRREHELLRAKSVAVALGNQTFRAETAMLLAGFIAGRLVRASAG